MSMSTLLLTVKTVPHGQIFDIIVDFIPVVYSLVSIYVFYDCALTNVDNENVELYILILTKLQKQQSIHC